MANSNFFSSDRATTTIHPPQVAMLPSELS
ncbi:hypothetical protein COLO4_17295 [Corchorus olitorius]|uniref:Uncharacterized protein n=1 Tax=Corchorus olitorius TaxID=93759 RepID=A0A1R3JDB8_9ROSI|nr:hypothetical protein COLO4_17295 [Corchorus olitorius]